MRTLVLIGNIALWAATVPSLLFVIFYARSRWERNSIGRHTMALSVVLASILFVNSLATIWPHYPGRIYLRLVTFILIVPVLWWRLINLLVVQHHVLRYNRRGKTQKEGREND